MWQVRVHWSIMDTEVGLLATLTYNVFIYPTMYSKVVRGVIRLTHTYLDPRLSTLSYPALPKPTLSHLSLPCPTLSYPVLHVGLYARAYRGEAGTPCPTCVRPFAVGRAVRSGFRGLMRKVGKVLRGDDVGIV